MRSSLFHHQRKVDILSQTSRKTAQEATSEHERLFQKATQGEEIRNRRSSPWTQALSVLRKRTQNLIRQRCNTPLLLNMKERSTALIRRENQRHNSGR